MSVKTQLLYDYYISQVNIRPSKEQVQGYPSILCTLGSQALTKGGIIIVKIHIGSYNTHILDYD